MAKPTCKKCEKTCRKNQRFCMCSSCKYYIHQKCSNFTRTQFECFSGAPGGNPFVCTECQKSSISAQIRSISLQSRNDAPTTVPMSTPGANNESSLGYHDFKTLNLELKSKQVDDLFILHLNIDSLVKYVDEIKSLISKTKTTPHIICVTETRLHDKKMEWQRELIHIKNYFLPNTNFDNSPTTAGGVAIYVHTSLKHLIKPKPEMKLQVPECESVFFELERPDKENVAKHKKIHTYWMHLQASQAQSKLHLRFFRKTI